MMDRVSVLDLDPLGNLSMKDNVFSVNDMFNYGFSELKVKHFEYDYLRKEYVNNVFMCN